jgi:hypothetical protein
MLRRTWGILALGAAALLLTGAFATASFAASYSISKPALSGAPHSGVAFTVSGITTPTAKTGVKTVVKVQVLMRNASGVYKPMLAAVTAKLVKRSGNPGYRYSRSITIPMTGKHAVQAFRYSNGKLVAKSALSKIDVGAAVQTVSIDGDSHAGVTTTAGQPIDVVFHYAASMCAANIHFEAAARFTKTCSDPLTYHADALPAGSYAWQCSMGSGCHGGTLVVE